MAQDQGSPASSADNAQDESSATPGVTQPSPSSSSPSLHKTRQSPRDDKCGERSSEDPIAGEVVSILVPGAANVFPGADHAAATEKEVNGQASAPLHEHYVEKPGEDVAEEKHADGGSGEGADDEAEDETKYPGGFALAILTFGLCMATFVVALDNTIIGEEIPAAQNITMSL